ncbi:MAG: hypothetical protein Q9195_009133 [Heterodermia aff. obscurata]
MSHFEDKSGIFPVFERVFLLNLPERTDKLDAFTLSSSLHSFTFDVIDGVDGSLIPNKSLSTLNNLPQKESDRNHSLGSWRAHLNFAQRIVRERISTAIIFEDDADWDVSLRTQLEQFAQGSQYISSTWTPPSLLQSKSSADPQPPYGADWDLLWLGHCGVTTHPADPRLFIISNDPTVPSPQRRVNYQDTPDMSGFSNATRIVHRVSSGCCLYSYALSQRGAQKMLLAQSSLTEFQPIDMGIRLMCRDVENFKCIGVFPQIIDSHKAAGSIERDSDIADFDKVQVREKGYTNNIVRSTRLNWGAMVAGRKGDEIEVQFPGEEVEVVGGGVGMRKSMIFNRM